MRRDAVPIPSPCSASWEEMRVTRPSERHCAQCRHAVVDLSAMTEKSAKRFLAQASGNTDLCVSYLVDDANVIAFRPAGRSLGQGPAVVGLALTLAACGTKSSEGAGGNASASAASASAQTVAAAPIANAGATSTSASATASLEPTTAPSVGAIASDPGAAGTANQAANDGCGEEPAGDVKERAVGAKGPPKGARGKTPPRLHRLAGKPSMPPVGGLLDL